MPRYRDMRTGRFIRACLCVCALAAFGASPSNAQLNVPAVPNLPVQVPGAVNDLTRQVDGALGNTPGAVNANVQATLRATRIRELLRTNRETLEADPNGAPMVRAQIVALSPSADARTRLQAAGFMVVQESTIDGLDSTVVVFAAPPGVSTRAALRRARAIDTMGAYDYNHIYLDSGSTETNLVAPNSSTPGPAIKSSGKLGLIDGGVDAAHPVFHYNAIHSWGCDGNPVPSAHGTAVASLMVGQDTTFHSAAPGASLYAADVYCGQATGGSLSAIASAFSWLSQQQVPVINISLIGPANVLLQQLVRNLIARGHIIVAAVGNDGPAAAPLYPAAYPGVIGVTAVDAQNRVLIEACRGKHVAFAAPGADMAAATLQGNYVAVRGTSFAAPIVAGLLVISMSEPDRAAADRALEDLSAQAVDLGSRGLDKIYGKGLVGASIRVSPELMAASAKTVLR